MNRENDAINEIFRSYTEQEKKDAGHRVQIKLVNGMQTVKVTHDSGLECKGIISTDILINGNGLIMSVDAKNYNPPLLIIHENADLLPKDVYDFVFYHEHRHIQQKVDNIKCDDEECDADDYAVKMMGKGKVQKAFEYLIEKVQNDDLRNRFRTRLARIKSLNI